MPVPVEQDIEKGSNNDAVIATLLRVVAVNGIGLRDGGTGVYTTVSRANHSCRPNAAFRIERDGRLTLVTVRSLSEDEEVTVSYLTEQHLLCPQSERQKRLSRWGFSCSCPRCVAYDDTRAFLCPSCGSGFVTPAGEEGAAWSACSSCTAVPPAEVLERAERHWGRRIPPPRGAGAGAPGELVACFEHLGREHRRQSGGGGAAGEAPAPALDGHWATARLAQGAAEELLRRGDFAAAAEAARWRWRFAKRALGGAASRTAVAALALRASAAALAAQLGRRGREERAALVAVARRRYGAALREASPLLPPDDAQLAALRKQRGLLDLLARAPPSSERRRRRS